MENNTITINARDYGELTEAYIRLKILKQYASTADYINDEFIRSILGIKKEGHDDTNH